MKKTSPLSIGLCSLCLVLFSFNLFAFTRPAPSSGNRTEAFTAVCFSPDMKSFAAGTAEGKMLKWSLETGMMTLLKEETIVNSDILHMAFSNDGQWLWWLRGGKLFRSSYPALDQTETMETGVSSFLFSHTGKYLAIGKQDGKIIILAPDQPEYKKELNPENVGSIKALAFSRSEKRIASSGLDGVIVVRDINTAFVYKRLDEGRKNKAIPTELMFNLNDQYLIAGSSGQLQLWDVFDGKIKKSSSQIPGIHTLKIGANGRSFFAGGKSGIYSVDLESLEKIKEIPAPKSNLVKYNEAKSMDISADGQFLLMGCMDNAARLWHSQYDGALLTFVLDFYPALVYAVLSASGDFFTQTQTNIANATYYVAQQGNYNPGLVTQVFQQVESEKAVETKEEIVNRAGKDYALFFVIGDYQEWGKLKNPVIDGEAIAGSLSDKYGFQTEVVVNPTRDQIYAQLEKYRSITFPDDGQLFVFFSGHGDFVESTGEGFLVPKEGLKSEKDRFQNSYIPHARLEKMLDAIPCRHILIALDACYSGTFDQEIAELKGETNFKRPGAGSKNAIVQRELQAQSRIYLTSGGKERTPDGVVHSPFAEKLLDALDGEGGDDGILTINELYGFLEKAAPKPRKGRFGKHDPSGTFLFVKQYKG